MAPSSPKEKRRTTRRSAHSSSKSSGSSSSSPDSAPLPPPPSLSEAVRSAASSSSTSAARAKRAKDDVDDFHVIASTSHRRTTSIASTTNGALNAPAPAASKRAKRKGKEVVAPVGEPADAAPPDAVDEKPVDSTTDGEKGDEDGGITRCVCESLDDDADAPDFMIQCDKCLTWQHGPCMGFSQESEIPEGVYYCEQCKPEDHVELLRKLAKRQRHSSEKSAQISQRSRTSRSHSPTQFLKQTKRRNTMNSRDAAYEESIQEILEQSAAEAAPHADTPAKDRAESVAKTEEVYEEIIEIGPGGRKKRKRLDDDMMPTKRKRSASLISEDVGSAITALDKADSAAPITTPLLPPPAPTKSRARRGGGRKNAATQEPSVNGEGEDAGTPTAKKHPNQYTYRGKNTNGVSRRAPQSATAQGQQTISTHEHGTRRNASNAANGGSGSGGSSRNNHNAYYNNVQLPMFASWGLPDYLAHLQSILPSEIPPPLQIRGATSFLKEEVSETTASGTVENANSQSNARGSMGPPPNEPTDLQAAQMASALANATESVTERGVKVKWPAKRMSVADMNKRVRALVEWVGREQALALDRERRKAALDNALQIHLEKLRLDSTITTTAEAAESAKANGDDVPEEPSAMSVDDTAPTTNEPKKDKITTAALPPPESDHLETPRLSFAACLNSSSTTRPSTSKMMEELMEELISFQERFGPSAKGQVRDRRVVALA